MEAQAALRQGLEGQGPASSEVARGVKLALPIVLGFVPVAFAFGVLARKAGLSEWNTVLMSILVFAGSAQLIGVGMLGAGASPLSVVLTCFVVNLRHLLMSAALAPYLGRWPRLQVALMAFELTDESFAVHVARFAGGDVSKAATFAVNATTHVSWVAGSLVGALASGLVADVRPLGLDFALPAMFAALLAFQLKARSHVLAAASGGILSVVLAAAGVTQWNVILSTVAAAAVGAWSESWTRE